MTASVSSTESRVVMRQRLPGKLRNGFGTGVVAEVDAEGAGVGGDGSEEVAEGDGRDTETTGLWRAQEGLMEDFAGIVSWSSWQRCR